MKKLFYIILILCCGFCNISAQTYPFAIENKGSSNVSIYTTSTSTTPFEYLASGSKLVAQSISNGRYKLNTVDANGGSSNYFYIPTNSITPSCITDYIQITATKANIRQSNTTTIGNVTSGGQPGYAYSGDKYAVKSSKYDASSVLWYEIFLTTRWNQSTGWVSSTVCTKYSSEIIALPPPSVNNASNITCSTAYISWNAVTGAEKYIVFHGSNVLKTVTSLNTTLNLSESTNYEVTVVAATNSSCLSGNSNTVKFSTTACNTSNPPVTPANLTAVSNSPTTIDLTWSAVSGANSYTIVDCSSGSSYTSNTNSYQVKNLSSSTYYSYKVRAENGDGNSLYSNCIGTTTKQQTSTTPTVKVTSPNGGEIWVVGQTNIVSAITSGAFSHVVLEYTVNGGISWLQFGTVIGQTSSINYSWKIPANPSSDCYVKITLVTKSGQKISDISDNTFNIQNSVQGTEFSLNSSLSHLFWPFPESSYHEEVNNSVRDGWKIRGSNHNQGGHYGGEKFAEDWASIYTCNKNFYAPMSGYIISEPYKCDPDCGSCPKEIKCCHAGLGNMVVIQSDVNTNYALKILHFNSVNVKKGDYVKVGSLLGTLGSTGRSSGPHAHIALFKDINKKYLNSNDKIIDRLKWGGLVKGDPSISVKFVFDAVIGGSDGGGQEEEPILIAEKTALCIGGSIKLEAVQGMHYYWNTGDTTQSITVTIPGDYKVTVIDSLGNYSVSQIVSVEYYTPLEIEILKETPFLCKGENLLLTVQTSSGGIFDEYYDDNVSKFKWSTGENTSQILVSTPGWYHVTIEEENGCASYIDSILIVQVDGPSKPTIQINGKQLAASTIDQGTYQWFRNGNRIDGEDKQYLSADTSGYYSVKVININGCSSTSEPVFVEVVGISENNLSQSLKISPNPTSGSFTLQYKSQISESIKIEIFSQLGKNIYTSIARTNSGEFTKEIQLRTNPGIYYLILTTSSALTTEKIIITK